MKGVAYLYRPGAAEPEIHQLTESPQLEWLKDRLDGGWIELVPQFNHVQVGEELIRCVAFCDEEGKLKNLPLNRAATIAWSDVLPTGLKNLDGSWTDVLVGPVLILTGDDEFMEGL